MLIFERFVFIHTPKTAGSFVAAALEQEVATPVARQWIHDGWNQIPPAAAELPVLMYVRNPWDWYVSWYHFLVELHMRRLPADEVETALPWLRLLFGEDLEITPEGVRGAGDFATVVRAACENLDPAHPAIARMAAAGEPHLDAIELGQDFYSARFGYLAGDGLGTDRLTVGRFESLLADLGDFFDAHGMPLGDDVIARIAARRPFNASAHRPYREYYDAELRDLVGRSCRRLVEAFGYSF